jgi:hypothetical protein
VIMLVGNKSDLRHLRAVPTDEFTIIYSIQWRRSCERERFYFASYTYMHHTIAT